MEDWSLADLLYDNDIDAIVEFLDRHRDEEIKTILENAENEAAKDAFENR